MQGLVNSLAREGANEKTGKLLDGDDVPLKFRVFFKLAVYSGYRRGELLGLDMDA